MAGLTLTLDKITTTASVIATDEPFITINQAVITTASILLITTAAVIATDEPFITTDETVLKKNAEFRIKTLVRPWRLPLGDDSLPLLYETQARTLSVGDLDPRPIQDHQIENLVGVQKRRLFIRQSHRILICFLIPDS